MSDLHITDFSSSQFGVFVPSLCFRMFHLRNHLTDFVEIWCQGVCIKICCSYLCPHRFCTNHTIHATNGSS